MFAKAIPIADFREIGHVCGMKQQWVKSTLLRNGLAFAAVSCLGFIYLGLNWEMRRPSFMMGRIAAFGLVEQKGYGQVGSVIRAQVDMPKGATISISLPNDTFCRIGSEVEIEEAHTVFGSRFKSGPRGCLTSALNSTRPTAD